MKPTLPFHMRYAKHNGSEGSTIHFSSRKEMIQTALREIHNGSYRMQFFVHDGDSWILDTMGTILFERKIANEGNAEASARLLELAGIATVLSKQVRTHKLPDEKISELAHKIYDVLVVFDLSIATSELRLES